MTKLKKKLWSYQAALLLVGVLAIGSLVYAYAGPAPSMLVEGDCVNCNIEAPEAPTTERELGAFSGPDIYSDYLNFNGITREYNSINPRSATTTICAIQSPSATSTLAFGSVVLDTSSTTAMTVSMAKAADAYSTTTALATDLVLAANNKAVLLASTTPVMMNNRTFEPNQWFVIGMHQSVAVGYENFAPQGKCKAEFIVLN